MAKLVNPLLSSSASGKVGGVVYVSSSKGCFSRPRLRGSASTREPRSLPKSRVKYALECWRVLDDYIKDSWANYFGDTVRAKSAFVARQIRLYGYSNPFPPIVDHPRINLLQREPNIYIANTDPWIVYGYYNFGMPAGVVVNNFISVGYSRSKITDKSHRYFIGRTEPPFFFFSYDTNEIAPYIRLWAEVVNCYTGVVIYSRYDDLELSDEEVLMGPGMETLFEQLESSNNKFH